MRGQRTQNAHATQELTSELPMTEKYGFHSLAMDGIPSAFGAAAAAATAQPPHPGSQFNSTDAFLLRKFAYKSNASHSSPRPFNIDVSDGGNKATQRCTARESAQAEQT